MTGDLGSQSAGTPHDQAGLHTQARVLRVLLLVALAQLENGRVSATVAVPAQGDQVFTPNIVLIRKVAWFAIGVADADMVVRTYFTNCSHLGEKFTNVGIGE